MTINELFALMVRLFPRSAVVKHANSVDVVLGGTEAIIVDLRPGQWEQTGAEIVGGVADCTVIMRDVPKNADAIERRISSMRRALARMSNEDCNCGMSPPNSPHLAKTAAIEAAEGMT